MTGESGEAEQRRWSVCRSRTSPVAACASGRSDFLLCNASIFAGNGKIRATAYSTAATEQFSFFVKRHRIQVCSCRLVIWLQIDVLNHSNAIRCPPCEMDIYSTVSRSSKNEDRWCWLHFLFLVVLFLFQFFIALISNALPFPLCQ